MKETKGLMIAHGETTHPASERWNCKICKEVEAEFVRVFSKDPKNWPFPMCQSSKTIINRIKKMVEERHEKLSKISKKG